jgi:hypothetical protein
MGGGKSRQVEQPGRIGTKAQEASPLISVVLLDLNNSAFQQQWFSLPPPEALAILATLRKIRQLEWDQVYRDKGLRWEVIQSRTGPGGQRIYSLRVTQKARAVAYRDGNVMRFLTLHADHDSAYE